MTIENINNAYSLIYRNEEEFRFPVDLNIMEKIQLSFTGKILKGVELFGIGAMELRGLGFMFNFREIINKGVSHNYRVFVKKEGKYFGEGTWYLEFIKFDELVVNKSKRQ